MLAARSAICLYEQRPAAAELPRDAPEEFLAVMESIEVDYGDLSPFTAEDAAAYG